MSHDAMENDATQTSEASKYQLISQPNKFQLQCYRKCSKWRTSTRFHTTMQVFAPVIDSVVAET